MVGIREFWNQEQSKWGYTLNIQVKYGFFKEYYQLFCKWMSLQKPIFPKVTSCFGRSFFFFFISCCSWIRDIYGLGWLWSRAYIQYLLTYMYGISYHLYPFLLLSNIDSLIWSFSYKTWESEIFVFSTNMRYTHGCLLEPRFYQPEKINLSFFSLPNVL